MRVARGRELGRSRVIVQEPLPGAQEQAGQANQGQKGENKTLTNDDVISMIKSGLAEDTIALAIQHSSTGFDTSAPKH